MTPRNTNAPAGKHNKANFSLFKPTASFVFIDGKMIPKENLSPEALNQKIETAMKKRKADAMSDAMSIEEAGRTLVDLKQASTKKSVLLMR